MDLEGARKRAVLRGLEAGGALSPPAAAIVGTRAFRSRWVVAACVTLLGFSVVCGLYRSPPALPLITAAVYSGSLRHQLLAGDGWVWQRQQRTGDDEKLQRRQQQRLIDDGLPQQRRQQPPVDGDVASNGFSGVPPRDKYLGGLLAAGFDERSCLSRYYSGVYRKPSPYKPSRYLVQKLRTYEERHRRCAPHTAAYNRTLPFLKAGASVPEEEVECKYALWTPWSGLGNRILTLASTFLYALLTDRVLLIDPGKDMPGLFCEPFRDTTWLLPPGFPISDFEAFYRSHPQSYANLLKSEKISNDGARGKAPPPFVYIHLGDDYQTEDMYFFCEKDQAVLRKVPWLFLRSDLYFVPGLFLNQEFEPELSRMFPEKETVFHHLGRYLFHPTNKVWGMITTYYRAYMAAAGERLGIQIRVFSAEDSPFELVSEQVINCTLKEKLLPEVDGDASIIDSMTDDPKMTKTVLITSLHSGYAEKVKDMYWEHPAAGGVVVSVHQPTHEERQQTDDAGHDAKAWAEMNLLSLADVLVTSAWSTFGYVAQGLGGIRPWVLFRAVKGVMPDPICEREASLEPCYHAPTTYVCREKKDGDNGNVVHFITRCRDATSGIKLVDRR
ncbi:hypothetical protein Taro_052590 [Colocasia esculenta]|uniref:Fucosyltransferase n=1 Tax=Colocasia esculenta TaxID=4460 RepID=A0A843XKJ5_COLES|nr:hypothetical protein [Colocasia esculenta]